MSERYATSVVNDDGEEVISAIALLEGKPTEPRGNNARIFKVPDGVKIGMVKGGALEPSGGFGFPDGSGLAAFKANPPDKEVKTRKTRASKTEDDTVDA